jgi:hypothetical protein
MSLNKNYKKSDNTKDKFQVKTKINKMMVLEGKKSHFYDLLILLFRDIMK